MTTRPARTRAAAARPAVAGLARPAAVAVVLLTTACDPGVGRACPAIDWGRTLVVSLAADWPTGESRSVHVACDSPCGLPASGGEPAGELTAPLEGPVARLYPLGLPGSVVVTVVGPAGPEAQVEADLDWRRVGGDEECGGPVRAEVTVPPP
ncbi:hypothetical protein ACI78V_19370 [Geodermatophilus sp. SYSU D00742]